MNIDHDTIVKASQGDIQAFEALFKEYFGFVSNVALRVVNRREDAEDIAQEIFMIIYRQLKNFRFESSLKTWIYRISINAAINYGKKAAKFRDQRVEYNDELTPGTSQDPRLQMDERINEHIITNLLEAVNPDQRACLVLRTVQGLSYQEIAETLKIPINTVRSRIKRARETMIALRQEVAKNEL